MVNTAVIYRLYWTLGVSWSLSREGTKNDMHLFKKKCICHEGGTSCFLAVLAMTDEKGQRLPRYLVTNFATETGAMSDSRFRGCICIWGHHRKEEERRGRTFKGA